MYIEELEHLRHENEEYIVKLEGLRHEPVCTVIRMVDGRLKN